MFILWYDIEMSCRVLEAKRVGLQRESTQLMEILKEVWSTSCGSGLEVVEGSNKIDETAEDVFAIVVSFLGRSNSSNFTVTRFSLYSKTLQTGGHNLNYACVALWKMIDSHLKRIIHLKGENSGTEANGIYTIVKCANNTRKLQNLPEIDMNTLLFHKYQSVLTPVMVLQRLILRSTRRVRVEFCVVKKGKKKCSFGDCRGVAALLVTSYKGENSYVAEFVFCLFHLQANSQSYNFLTREFRCVDCP